MYALLLYITSSQDIVDTSVADKLFQNISSTPRIAYIGIRLLEMQMKLDSMSNNEFVIEDMIPIKKNSIEIATRSI